MLNLTKRAYSHYFDQQKESLPENKACIKQRLLTLPCPIEKHLKHNMDVRQKTQKQHLWHNTKGAIFLHSGGLKLVLAAVVISHWSGQRGEFPVLHHSDGCVQLHYARAAGSPGCWGRSSSGLTPLAQGLRPRFMGQGLVRTQAWLLANGSS